MEQNQNESGMVRPWLLIVLGIVVIAGIGFFVWNMQQNKKTATVATTPTTTPANSAVSTADWKTYTNTDLGFSFKYPKDWGDVKINLINNLKDGIGGKFLTTSDGQNGTLYFDKNKVFGFYSQAKNYIQGPPVFNTSFSQIKVNPDWTASQLATEMGFDSNGMPKILMVKKLSPKTLLVATYLNVECSPGMGLSVITPLNNEFPNLEININSKDYSDDLTTFHKSLKEDQCDSLASSKQVADKIKNGSYTNLNTNIQIAQLIADSLELTK